MTEPRTAFDRFRSVLHFAIIALCLGGAAVGASNGNYGMLLLVPGAAVMASVEYKDRKGTL